MSAYSAEMLEACKTVTLNVKVLPIFRWERAFSGERSRGRSRPRPGLFTGLRGASMVATWNRNTCIWYFCLRSLWIVSTSPVTVQHFHLTPPYSSFKFWLVQKIPGLHRRRLTWTGVVVDFISRDSYLGVLSFSLHNSQLLLGGVGVGQTTGTRLSLELEQDRKQSAWTSFTPNVNVQEQKFKFQPPFLKLSTLKTNIIYDFYWL